mmetsp:Transcript_9048/g.15294  ORF Transcript_9048/g.15294 Transcript_9048/m.15294 type:complete len:243 (-) Transcript_9048:279-1007(-)|eukprot:CAMPEP_0168614994 /NCGR_PEP_ID=MMETSP0449_2-20121227/4270_1 /TAXON_ID=1082188 /ORGANISM="Strombidium rassoulzadegani, Strain ras09" /LENGTH=242 /DNA_ID=CAMNT_0008655709 /DNA_START=266 /DNA_END=994 /DNA_ORIENTATION=-
MGEDLVVEVLDHLASDGGVDCSDLEDLAVGHLDDAVGEVLEALVVGDHDHRDLVLDIEVDQDLHDDVRRLSVQVSRGLIEQQNGGIVRNGPRDGHSLLLSSRKHVGEVVESLAQPHLGQKLFGSLPDLIPAQLSPQLHGQLHVLEGGERANQVEGLEDEAQLVQPDRRKHLVLGAILDPHSADVDVALGGLVDGSDDVQHRSLTSARGSQDCDEFSVLYREVDSSEGWDTLQTQQVGLVHIH